MATAAVIVVVIMNGQRANTLRLELLDGGRGAGVGGHLGAPEEDLLLAEVPPVVNVDEDEVEVVAHAELVVHVAVRGRELVGAEVEADGNNLAAHGGAVHDLELGDVVALIEGVGTRAQGLALDDHNLHVLDLETDEQDVNLAHHDVLEIVLRALVLELDVQRVLDADLHLDRIVQLRSRDDVLDREVEHLCNVGVVLAHDLGAQEVAQTHVITGVGLGGLFDVGELELVRLGVSQLARVFELADVLGEELVRVEAIVAELCTRGNKAKYQQKINKYR